MIKRLLPVDPLSSTSRASDTQLVVVDHFKYLGIIVSPNLNAFISLNILPLLTKFQQKVTTWTKLPLSVAGRTNLVKMILMPQLLYVVHNSPVWLPYRYFHKFQALFRALVWRRGTPRIRYETLQRPKDEGGLAAPNPWLYFLASQLQYLKGWDDALSTDPVHRLLYFIAGGRGLLPALEAGFPVRDGRSMPTIKLYVRVWDRAKLLLNLSGCTPFTPVWRNPKLAEISKLQGFSQVGFGWDYLDPSSPA